MKQTILLLAFLSPLLAEIPASDLSSDHASYDGDTLILSGHVQVEHDLGTLKADKARLNKGDSPYHFSTIQLDDQVSIFFDTQGNLYAENAFIDMETLSGTFTSKDYPIIYKGTDYDLYCKKMTLSLEETDRHTSIKNITADGDVHIENHNGVTIDADHTSYSQNILMATGESPCILKQEEDQVDAKTIYYDLDTTLLTLEDPKGRLSSLFFPDDPQRHCNFSSRLLVWDQKQDLLTLKRDISIEDPAFGKLEGDHLFSLKERKLFGKRTLQSIETEGKTTLTTHDNETLINYGTMRLDRDELVITCQNPPDQRLKYEKEDLLLFADSARIEYAFQGLEMKPHAIYLDGNVQILSHDLSRPLRKGIADHIFHDPVTKQTHLIADEGSHVLFWDEEKKLSLSAPEILIEHGEEDLVKGLGTVRFTFTEEEGKKIDELLHHKGDK
ncbi:MAG: hypothetical protein H7A38_01705 [Chlamydiales bacterium]|nr:hypothetical protein [Chlamydiales bacterium]